MSRLTVYRDDAPGTPELRTEDPAAMMAALAPIAVGFERWDSSVTVTPDDDADTILAAYRPHLDRLMGSTGAGSADVIKLTPNHPQMRPMREKFLQEHRHSEPEVRFFVHGSANFILHVDGRVYDVHCTQGDLIHVPADIPHWFDAGEQPFVTALRVFTNTDGWVARFTGDTISERFPAA